MSWGQSVLCIYEFHQWWWWWWWWSVVMLLVVNISVTPHHTTPLSVSYLISSQHTGLSFTCVLSAVREDDQPGLRQAGWLVGCYHR